MIKAVIFDCFGVLVGRGFSETYRIAGGDPVADRDFITDTMGEANMGLIPEDEFERRMSGRLGVTPDEYRDAVVKAEQPNEELLSYIEELHKTYKTAVLSNANRGVLPRKLTQEVLDNHFDAVVISGDVGVVKPNPEIYLMSAEKLGVEPAECVFTDDLKVYCEAARETGMQAIWYENFVQFRRDLEKLLAKYR